MPAPTLDTTVGGANANSYASLDEFKAYISTRLPVAAWTTGATDDQLTVALEFGAKLLDACFAWTGAAVDDVQALAWPRSGMSSRNGFPIATTIIPQQLKDAQCEFAVQLGNGDLLSDNDAKKKGISGVKAGSVSVSFQTIDTATAESVDILIRQMGSDLLYVSDTVPQAVRMLLVSSWFAQPSIKRPVLISMF
jgi:hypothetical protein